MHDCATGEEFRGIGRWVDERARRSISDGAREQLLRIHTRTYDVS